MTPSDALADARLVEALGFISTEIHQQYGAYFTGGGGEQKAQAAQAIKERTAYLAESMRGDFLLGSTVSAADFYLFVMLLWAKKRRFDVPERLEAYRDRMMELPSAKKAMEEEGLA